MNSANDGDNDSDGDADTVEMEVDAAEAKNDADVVAEAVDSAVSAAELNRVEGMSHADAVSRQARVLNANEADRIERLVEQTELKVAAVKNEIISSEKPSDE